MSTIDRVVLSPREVAQRAGFSYHAILRAIRRGDLRAFEPVPGRYRISVSEYERWLQTPAQPVGSAGREATEHPNRRPRSTRTIAVATDPGSFARLTAIEGDA